MKIRHSDGRWTFDLSTYKDTPAYSVTVRLFRVPEHFAQGDDPYEVMSRALAWALERDGRVRYSRVYKPGTDHVYPEGSVFQDPRTGGPFTFTHLSASRLWLVGRDRDGQTVSHTPEALGVEVRDEWEPEAGQ